MIRISVFLVIFATSLTKTAEGNKYENQILDFILENYGRSRPVEDHRSTLNVHFNISLKQLIQVDEKHQTININLWRTMNWKDYSLKWNSENYGNITEITVKRGQIWRPDVQLLNLASYEENQFDIDGASIVKNDGTVFDVLPMVVKSTCTMDVTWFPFDEQKCPLVFGSWIFAMKDLSLELEGIRPEVTDTRIISGRILFIRKFNLFEKILP